MNRIANLKPDLRQHLTFARQPKADIESRRVASFYLATPSQRQLDNQASRFSDIYPRFVAVLLHEMEQIGTVQQS